MSVDVVLNFSSFLCPFFFLLVPFQGKRVRILIVGEERGRRWGVNGKLLNTRN